MLSNFSFDIDNYCSPEVNFEFTQADTVSGTTSSGFEFSGYNIDFPSEPYTYSYDFLRGNEYITKHNILPGNSNIFTSVCTSSSGIVMTTAHDLYEVKDDVVIDLEFFSSFISDSYAT